MNAQYSVIIPTYNRSDLSLRAIKSVLTQSLPPLEVWVVDDASTPQNLSSLESGLKALSSQKVKLLKHEKNKGVSAARNTGVLKASSSWVAFLDSDDEWLSHKIERQFESLSKTQLLYSHTDENWIRNGKLINKKKAHKKYGGHVFQKALKLCFMGPSTSLMHKSIFEKIGLFDETMPLCEDYDLWLRLTPFYKIDYVDSPLINKWAGHEDQLSMQGFGMDYWRLYALKKQLKNPKLSAEDLKAVKQTFESKYQIVHQGCLNHNNQELLLKLLKLQDSF